MGLSIYNIKKWTKMLTGHSEMHVHQTLGKQFTPGEIKGYFNNMTEKVFKESELIDSNRLPMNHAEQGDVIFPVTIFQYALGCYDLFLETHDERYRIKFLKLADWAVTNQEQQGGWDNFSFIYPDAPYGSMCQGEGASVLVRAYKETGSLFYLDAAIKAIDFMIKPIEQGGTAKYEGEDILFFEFTNKPIVLNGWIFSLFGLYDINLATNGLYKDTFDKAVKTIEKYILKFDNGFWSMYDLGGRISSPFYHELHIYQLEALYIVLNRTVFREYKERFMGYQTKILNKSHAFIIKAMQKIRE